MTTRPEYRVRYPKEWRDISRSIKTRAAGRCECEGECGLHGGKLKARRCEEHQGEKAKWAHGEGGARLDERRESKGWSR